ncbi:Ribonuclease H [Abeliophyllum distichum]|uniref:Ribonuclease H n=1 Tax=Abeliophyllum distichum TaxID=126358 RepID=A0ABD1SCA5_9LAMI
MPWHDSLLVREIEELESIPIEKISNAAINQPEHTLTMAELKHSWIDEIIQFLKHGTIPQDSAEAKRLRTSKARYMLRCLREDEAQYILSEAYEGVCGNDNVGQSLAHKILRQGYFWPSLKKDSIEFARKSDKYQRFAPTIKAHPKGLTSILNPWPFSKWKIDLTWPNANEKNVELSTP